MCLDVHGDEALPYIFLAGNEVRASRLGRSAYRKHCWVFRVEGLGV